MKYTFLFNVGVTQLIYAILEIKLSFRQKFKYYFETGVLQQLCFDPGSNFCSKKCNIFS